MTEAVRRWRPAGWEIGVIAAVVIACAAIAGATVSFVTSQDAVTRVTKIEQTPCGKNPSGGACQKLRAEVEQAAGVGVTCVPFHKAGYVCPKPGSPLAKEKGVVPSKPESGTSLPGPTTGPTGSTESPHPVLEATGTVVEEAGQTVTGTVEELTCKVRLTC